MRTVKVKNVVIGEGMPKICVPIVGSSKKELLNEINVLKQGPADLVEWRMDGLTGIEDDTVVLDTVKTISDALGELPLLSTFRTANEGGSKELSKEAYLHLNEVIIKSGYSDLIDVELFTGDKEVSDIVSLAHKHHVSVVMSNHDFAKTPDYDELILRLKKMIELDADLPKIAVMPVSTDDVLTLLKAANDMAFKYSDRPIITMSMSGTGAISRICGECFGSALTFGSAAKASAPGQIPADQLKTVLEIIHSSIK